MIFFVVTESQKIAGWEYADVLDMKPAVDLDDLLMLTVAIEGYDIEIASGSVSGGFALGAIFLCVGLLYRLALLRSLNQKNNLRLGGVVVDPLTSKSCSVIWSSGNVLAWPDGETEVSKRGGGA